MIATLLCALLFVGGGMQQHASEFCSLVVKVTDAKGRETDAVVTVEEHDGTTVRRANESGGARFCGLGISPVTVTVGAPECNQVTVRNVGLEWGATTILHVTYDVEPCLVDAPPVAACEYLFRFIAPDHKPVRGVSVTMNSPDNEVYAGDAYGRVHIAVTAPNELRATAEAPGYPPVSIHLPCNRDNYRVEQKFILKPSAGK